MSEPLRELTTGLEAVEDAILAALREDPLIAAYIRTVESWQGTLEHAIQQAGMVRDPAILVLFAGGPVSKLGGHHRCLAQWQILVRDRNLRGNSARRRGESTEPGTYVMVGDVLRVLTGNDLGLDGVAPFEPVACDLLQAGRDPSQTTSAYLVSFEASLDLLAIAPETDLASIELALQVANPNESTGTTAWSPSLPLTIELETE